MKNLRLVFSILIAVIMVSCTQYRIVTWPPADSGDEDTVSVVSLEVTEKIIIEADSSAPSTVKAVATYSDKTIKECIASVSEVDTSTAGEKTATATYKGISTSFTLIVYEKENLVESSDDLSSVLDKASENEIIVLSGEIKTESLFTLPKGARLIGLPGTTLTKATTGTLINAGDGSSIDGIDFETTTNEATETILINVAAGTVSVSNCSFSGEYILEDNPNITTRAFAVSPGNADLVVDNCTFENIRQPGYINDGTTGKITNCTVRGTRGWVIGSNTNIQFENNTFENNAVDIAIINASPSVSPSIDNYSKNDCIAISEANGGCFVQNQIAKFDIKNGQETEYTGN